MWRWLIPLAVGLLGIAAGVLYGWVINPVKFVDTTPASLRADYRSDYVLMVAESYHANQDVPLAVRRLAILGTESPAAISQSAASTARQSGFSPDDIHLIEELTRALQAAQPISPAAGTP